MANTLNIGITNSTASVRTIHTPLINAVTSLKYIGIVGQEWQDLPSMLSDPSTHIVLVSAPLQNRSTIITQCLQAGKHVLSEVPLASTAAETSALIDLAKKEELLLCPMFRNRYDGDYNTLSSLRRRELLGDWREWTIYDLENPAEEDRISRRIDQVHHFLGLPDSVTASEDMHTLTLHYALGPLNVTLRFEDHQEKRQYIVKGTKGTYEKVVQISPSKISHLTRLISSQSSLDPQIRQLSAGISPLDTKFGLEPEDNYGTLSGKPYPTTRTPTWRGLYEDFAKAIRGEHHNPCAPEDALAGQMILETMTLTSNLSQSLSVSA